MSSYKNIILIFSLARTAFFTFVVLVYIKKMVNSDYNPDNYKSLKISIGSIIKNPKMLRYILDHLKRKKILKEQLKNCCL